MKEPEFRLEALHIGSRLDSPSASSLAPFNLLLAEDDDAAGLWHFRADQRMSSQVLVIGRNPIDYEISS